MSSDTKARHLGRAVERARSILPEHGDGRDIVKQIFVDMLDVARREKVRGATRPNKSKSLWPEYRRTRDEQAAAAQKRKEEIESGADPFVIFGNRLAATSAEIASMEAFEDLLNECRRDNVGRSENPDRDWQLLALQARGWKLKQMAERFGIKLQRVAVILNNHYWGIWRKLEQYICVEQRRAA